MILEMIEKADDYALDFFIDELKYFVENDLSQVKSNGIEKTIDWLQSSKEGKKLVKEILDSKKAGKFRKQSPRAIAHSSCTIASRYGYIIGAMFVAPHVAKNPLVPYGEHYIKRIADESVVLDRNEDPEKKVYTYISDSAKLVAPYATPSYWEIARGELFSRNADMIAEMKRQNRKVVLIRENSEAEYDGSGHTLMAIRNSKGQYEINDTYHGQRFGKTMEERYHTNGSKWLRWIYGELNI